MQIFITMQPKNWVLLALHLLRQRILLAPYLLRQQGSHDDDSPQSRKISLDRGLQKYKESQVNMMI